MANKTEAEQANFAIGEYQYEIKMLPLMESVDLFEDIVAGLDTMLDAEDIEGIFSDDADKIVPNIIKAVLKLDKAFLASLRTRLFEHVYFTNPDLPGKKMVLGSEDEAFEDVIAVYEVTVRALAVNFGNSIRQSGSRFGRVVMSLFTSQ